MLLRLFCRGVKLFTCSQGFSDGQMHKKRHLLSLSFKEIHFYNGSIWFQRWTERTSLHRCQLVPGCHGSKGNKSRWLCNNWAKIDRCASTTVSYASNRWTDTAACVKNKQKVGLKHHLVVLRYPYWFLLFSSSSIKIQNHLLGTSKRRWTGRPIESSKVCCSHIRVAGDLNEGLWARGRNNLRVQCDILKVSHILKAAALHRWN